ncbi:MAG TPA: hypothetical protein PLO37_02635 [Candidatus Hydrogenedentes bacterium]|nr:hypothetical protein [Candidatus Hydrogenedentota bacterium]HPG65716.1 hypothetical protein [Candidatus Hydrogenedentota bacterium]
MDKIDPIDDTDSVCKLDGGTTWTRPPVVGLVVTYAPLEVGCDAAPALARRAAEALAPLPIQLELGAEPVHDVASALAAAERMRAAEVDAVIWLAATWAFDSTALEFVRRCPVPIVAWGVPGMETGSVCGSQQLVEVLTELGYPRAFVHGAVDDAHAQASALAFVQGAGAAHRLKRARFGMLGHRTVGMAEVTFHELDVYRQFGSLIYYQGADRLLAGMDSVEPAEVSHVWNGLRARCGACAVSNEDGLRAARCYLALRQWIRDARLDGVAVGCYPDLMGLVCIGCGLLAEEGIVTSCEGDMNSAILTAAMQLLSGRPVHNTDFLFAHEDENACTMSHCGNSAISLAANEGEVALEHVRLMDRGVVTRYTGASGPVTLANLCGAKDTYRLAYYTGEAVATDMTFPGIPVKVRLDTPVEQFLEETADFGAGHHWMVAYGDLAPGLDAFAEITGLHTLAG